MKTTDAWKFYKDVDFSDTSILHYSIDTRDFHCIADKEDWPDTKLDLEVLEIYPDRFTHTATETMVLLDRYFNESGGKKGWRMFSLEGKGDKVSGSWELKYLRIHRTDKGLVFCGRKNRMLNKEILASKVNQEYLNAF